ncbi:Pimeloyl-ACP methyl ester carboxylesterase [Geodermatophilus dictyosporus]|uniref:Pimeloyl-ACP methyl ester carboxylesterase n=1 Tax=Geodermatophilus dictyosporus TaxID=1523247 RepID=A0A1I5S9Y7_9ACTN|nr:alpha/beta fold hydrolase [Geodermatophilus dictyosporus]SFP67535.1 Pimeloyl-ACP methyl ester carboxylesterase [Geodermatophilus dictyosporus]
MPAATSTAEAAGPTAERAPHTGPIRWIVVGSLLTGLLLAAVLSLVVFAGAPEHVITGSALLGFAAGWALLAVLSAWMTSQPQRWAWVPTAGLAATGLGLLVVAPGDGGLTAAGWVWPPALLTMAVWIGVRIRRALAAGSGRWLLYPVVVVIAASAVGGAVETVGLASDDPGRAMPGEVYDVGSYRLHLNCTGSGGPTVVLFNGLGLTSANWARVVPGVARSARVCAYDRAGQGWSEDAPQPRDGNQAAADLHALLQRAGEEGPYVLVGHSIGGDHAMIYAARYPEQVAGMVLLDATDPYRVGGGPPSAMAVLPSLARLGVGRLPPTSYWSTLPEPAAGQVRMFNANPRGWRNVRDEIATLPALLTQARDLTTLGDMPLVVLTAAGAEDDPARLAGQERMAALSTNSSHRPADAGHGALLDEERGAASSVQAVQDVVQAVRAGTPLL